MISKKSFTSFQSKYSLSKDDVKNISNVMKQIEVKINKKMPGTES